MSENGIYWQQPFTVTAPVNDLTLSELPARQFSTGEVSGDTRLESEAGFIQRTYSRLLLFVGHTTTAQAAVSFHFGVFLEQLLYQVLFPLSLPLIWMFRTDAAVRYGVLAPAY